MALIRSLLALVELFVFTMFLHKYIQEDHKNKKGWWTLTSAALWLICLLINIIKLGGM